MNEYVGLVIYTEKDTWEFFMRELYFVENNFIFQKRKFYTLRINEFESFFSVYSEKNIWKFISQKVKFK